MNSHHVNAHPNMKTLTRTFSIAWLIALLSCTGSTPASDRADKRAFNDTYTGKYLSRVAFPIGGIGAGMFCLEGTGAISHMSVRNRPDVFNEPFMFAAISVKGINNGAKILEGQVPDWKKFGAPSSGRGGSGRSWGLPRFENATFLARFPFAYIDLKHTDIPLDVQIKGWSPFIPNDADNSSLPVGALEYSFKNTGNKELEAVFSYNSRNFMTATGKSRASIKAISNGFVLANAGDKDSPHTQGDFAIFTNEPITIVDHCWFRGSWWDPVTMLWNNIAAGGTRSNPPVESEAPGASLYVPFSLKPGETRTIRLMMSWYVPHTTLNIGRDPESGPEPPCCDYNYKPWYTSQFKDIQGVVDYWKTMYADLEKKSKQFKDAFYASTLPAEVIEAVAANLTILKSPTVLRQDDGRLWGWEGSHDDSGSWHGTCTHVWNYAQAVPHLFPQLERTLRETEFFENQNEEGFQSFRAALPIRPVMTMRIPAADGQLGGIIKVYRDWRISGDSDWLRNIYPYVLRSLDYCINTWDPRGTGMLEEPQHNTYDIEFWGPNGMCTSIYLGALKAISEMGTFLGEDIAKYESLYERGRKAMEKDLWDGEYFIQKIKWEGLNAPSPVEQSAQGSLRTDYSSPEAQLLLQKEGPKYQYGNGCLSDGVIGVWLGEMGGLNDIVDAKQIESHLVAVHKYNLKKSLINHANLQRPGFALGHEAGLILCTWPKGGKVSIPFIFSDEVWTGVEYQVASHLMLYGHVEKGLDIVRACRDRYDGRVRNPFNEYEAGHWYSRALSSYALLQGLTGVRYDAVTKTLYIDSQIGDDFTSFFSCHSGYGNVGLDNGIPFVKMASGSLDVKRCLVSGEECLFSESNMR